MPIKSESALPGGSRVAAAMEGAEWETVEAPAWLTGIDANDQSFFILLRARDCLTCLDLGRRLREYERVDSVAAIHIVTTLGDSAMVDRFLRQEKVESKRLAVTADIGFGLAHWTGHLPAMVFRSTDRGPVEVIELRWTIADTVSFAGLLERRQAWRSQVSTRK
jgi:hypothetical protein